LIQKIDNMLMVLAEAEPNSVSLALTETDTDSVSADLSNTGLKIICDFQLKPKRFRLKLNWFQLNLSCVASIKQK